MRKAGGVVVKFGAHTVCSPELSFRKAYLGAWDVTKVIVLFTKANASIRARKTPFSACLLPTILTS